MDILQLLPYIIVLLIFLGVYYFYYLEKKRTENLKKLAMRSGYEFSDKMDVPKIGSEFFNQGHGQKAKNCIKYKDWEVFDYAYTVGHGKSSTTYNQTVAVTSKTLPYFILKSENFFDRIVDKFTKSDIDFKDHPEFSKKYLLKGDEKKIRELFNPNVLKFFEDQTKKPYLEASGGKLIICYTNLRKKPEEIRSFLEECERMAGLFEK